MTDRNNNYELAETILGSSYARLIKNRYHLVRNLENDEKEYCGGMFETDYVRVRTLLLAADELNARRTEGAVAELGVYRGDFARYLNGVFPGKKCYLFDTFEGFNQAEADRERNSGYCTEAFLQPYRSTDIDMVLESLPFPETAVVKQGYFPMSLDGLEEQFCFVSIDVDLEESIYQGLFYFYPRLGVGYIFIHDYNSRLKGVKRAVARYEEENGIRMSRVPICDANGTLVVTK